jgi:hypothetical protein
VCYFSLIHSRAASISNRHDRLITGATLSDLSFVLVNNSEGKYVELGIIAESLQMAEGC